MGFEGDAGWPDEIEAAAATQKALDAERDEIDAAASEDVAAERTVPWVKNAAWDGDTSFIAGLTQIGTLLSNTVPVITGFKQLLELGDLSDEVLKREIELSITDRVLIFTALQVFGIVSGERYRVEMDALLTRLEGLIEPTEIEEAAINAAEEVAARVYAEKLREHFAEAHPEVAVYTPEEFAEEMQNRDTEDATIKRLQAEQDAGLN